MATKLFNWFCQRSLDGPSVPLQARLNNPRTEAGLFAPFCQRQSLVFESNQVVTALIPGLLLSCCPSAIRRLIVTIIIRESVKGMILGWSRSHIGQESRKVFPSIAHLYSTSAVVFKSIRFGIATAVKHPLPQNIFWLVRKAMRYVAFYGCVPAKATTANSGTLSERFAFDCFFNTAVTTAKPKRTTIPAFFKVQHKNTSKPLSADIDSLSRTASAFGAATAYLFTTDKRSTSNDFIVSAIAKTFPVRLRPVLDKFKDGKCAEFLSGHINVHGFSFAQWQRECNRS